VVEIVEEVEVAAAATEVATISTEAPKTTKNRKLSMSPQKSSKVSDSFLSNLTLSMIGMRDWSN
jgi:hypothetical protein